jgi:hypothetical protein
MVDRGSHALGYNATLTRRSSWIASMQSLRNDEEAVI